MFTTIHWNHQAGLPYSTNQILLSVSVASSEVVVVSRSDRDFENSNTRVVDDSLDEN